jgi:hypothetical protein
MYNKNHSVDACAKMSIARIGAKNPAAKSVYVFGNLYSCAKDASDMLRTIYNQKTPNFIRNWIYLKRDPNELFYITKDFYDFAVENKIEIFD